MKSIPDHLQYHHVHLRPRRSAFTSCVITFILGWITGSIFIFLMISSRDNPGSSLKLSSFIQNTLLTNPSLPYHKFLRYNSPATLMPQLLPEFNRNSSYVDDLDDRMHIFLDWPMSDKDLTIHNYKAFESLLTAFPHAAVRLYLTAPKDLHYYKIPHLLSTKIFEKYVKLGYDIAILPVDTHIKSKLSNIGLNYRQKYYTLYTRSCLKTSLKACQIHRKLPPFHLLMFTRLLYLWRKGGIFSDFMFYFYSSLTENIVSQGYYMNSYCLVTGVDGSKTLVKPKTFESWQRIECITSTLLVST